MALIINKIPLEHITDPFQLDILNRIEEKHMSVREKEPEKDTATQAAAHEGELIWEGLKPRTQEEENQSVREALRRIAPKLAQEDGDIVEKLLYEFQFAQRISTLQQEKYAWLAEQEEQRKKSVFESTLELARRGDIDAQKQLCKFYQTGFGTQVSESSAFQWILNAAQNGDEDAQRKVAAFLYNGYGTEKDDESGFYWSMRAAEQGSSKAQKHVGDYYSCCSGVQQDLEAAFVWYLKAAENGDRSAKYLVGLCYYEGTGVPQDLTLAFQWMKTAAPEYGPARRFLKKHQKEFLQFSGEES